MKIELHTSPTVFTDLAGEWDTLLPPTNSLNFFMRSDWQRIWWKHLHRGELRVLTLRDDAGKLQGVAPMFAETHTDGQTTLEIVGCVDVTDYIDMIFASGQEQTVLTAMWGFLCSAEAPGWDMIRICNIPHGSPTLTFLPEIAAQSGSRVEVRQEDVCPVIELADSYDGYLETLDKKQRHELRRKRRRADAYPVGYDTVGAEHSVEDEIESFLTLMAMSTPDKASFLQERGHRDFFTEMGAAMLASGLLDLSFLTVEGQRVAALWNFSYGDRMMLYNSGLNPVDFAALSPGIILLSLNIEDAIRRGFKKYDFLQGGEEYKYRMGAQSTAVHTLTIQR